MPTKLRSKPATPSRDVAVTELADAELLQRFARHKDNASFAELVRRHGPLVMGVCRRVLQHDQDTEDAYQATFLILARKAGTIHKRQSLPSWLYKVAYRIALRARAGQARRRSLVNHLRERPAELSPNEERDLNALIQEEVYRLPEKYRAPVVLCYLQGLTNEEAAGLLCCPTGTVKIRLLRARELLRKRLLRRGIGLSIFVALANWSEQALAAPTPHLAEQAVNVVRGEAGVSARVRQLTEGWYRQVARVKLKVACSVLLTLVLLVVTDQLAQSAGLDQYVPVKPLPTNDVPTSPGTHEPANETEAYRFLVQRTGELSPRERNVSLGLVGNDAGMRQRRT